VPARDRRDGRDNVAAMAMQHGASARSAKEAVAWVQAHAELSRLAGERAALDAEEGRWLLCAWRSAVHVHLGYASFAQYIERLFGYKPRTTQESCGWPRRSRFCPA
jgi:hypothetical protein